jgi:HK97 family phage prohead protease
MFENKRIQAPLSLKADGSEGSVQAVFSTFDVVDKGGDVVLASAFTHGQEVPMTWAHQWDMPIGKGVVLVEPGRALFDGAFFMDTQAGQEAYKTVRAMGSLQEWSWGFRVTDAAFEQRGDEFIRLIKKAQLFEVSPVLVGEGENTFTLGIKGGMPIADESEAVLAAVKGVSERLRALATLRAKEGRVLSDANRKRLSGLLESLDAVSTDIKELLAATEPAPKAADMAALFVEYQRIVAGMMPAR